MDNKIKNAAIVSRSVTDFILLLDVALQMAYPPMDLVHGTPFKRRPLFRRPVERVPWMNVLIDFLALLPIPQIMILVLFANMKSTMYLENRWRMMLLPLFQFVPRVIRIYLLCKELSRSSTPNDITGTAWVRGTFNFFLFILASHVVGAFWYCFSVERELHCWQRACKYNSGCRANTFFCDDITGNERFVDEFCPINPPDPVLFDFWYISRCPSIYCFFWGLRGLSSFGSNLTTSSYSCENIFAAFVSIAWILLVVYLIGNLQVCLQSSTSRSEERRRMMQNKQVEINSWINDCGVKHREKEIMEFVRHKFDGNNDVNLKTLLDVFPPTFADTIKEMLCLPILREVQELENVEEVKLKKIIKHMKPVVFAEQSLIVIEGEPVDQFLLFIRGNGRACSRVGGETGLLEIGNFFGTQFLEWAKGTRGATEIPVSRITLRSQTKMEAFALMAIDLNKIPSSYFCTSV